MFGRVFKMLSYQCIYDPAPQVYRLCSSNTSAVLKTLLFEITLEDKSLVTTPESRIEIYSSVLLRGYTTRC